MQIGLVVLLYSVVIENPFRITKTFGIQEVDNYIVKYINLHNLISEQIIGPTLGLEPELHI